MILSMHRNGRSRHATVIIDTFIFAAVKFDIVCRRRYEMGLIG